ncbi:hypothetical protein ACIHFD_49595 [Nonomuraea sp. NPDC051941]|uniref:hypothetical protein n=1 Tax=Nonomuraea sp. NPDC051941 TaxID=3364373 RepID=UPI0037C88A9D
MRHLNPLHIPQLPASPATPPAGYVAVAAGLDGRLQTRSAAGVTSVVPSAHRVSLAQDVTLHAARPDWAAVSGLQLDLPSGVHRVSGVFTMTTSLGRWAFTSYGFDGPASGRILKVDQAETVAGSVYGGLWFSEAWGNLINGVRGGDDATERQYVVAELLVLMPEPGQVTLLGQVETPRAWHDFDGTSDNWSMSGADVDESNTDYVHSGSLSGKIVAVGDERAVLYVYEGASPATTWSCEAWMYSPTGLPWAGLEIDFMDDNGESLGIQAAYSALPAGVWTRRAVTGIAPARTTQIYAQVGLETANNGAAAGNTVYVDDIVLAQQGDTFTVKAGSYLQTTPM